MMFGFAPISLNHLLIITLIDSLLGTINGSFFNLIKSIVSPGKSDNGLFLLIKAVIFMLPAMIGLLFVIPLGIYHNVFTLLLLLLGKLKKPKYYIWKGIESNVYQRQKKESSEKGAQE